jgi:WhiB family redox-sensing transcriptional regulator
MNEELTRWLMTPEAPPSALILEALVKRPEWHRRAACRGADVDVFFPSNGESFEADQAFCSRCEVRIECLNAALAKPSTKGTWGGTSEQQRVAMRRRGVA